MDEKHILSRTDPMKWVYKLIKLQNKWIPFILIICLIDVTLSITIALTTKDLTNYAFSYSSNKLVRDIILFIVLILLNSLFVFIKKYYNRKFVINSMINLKEEVFKRIQSVEISYFENNHSGKIMSIFSNDIASIESFLDGNVYLMMYVPISIIMIGASMIYFRWKLFVMSIIIIPIIMFLSYLILRPITILSEKLQNDKSKSTMLIMDAISGANVIKAFNLQEKFTLRFRATVNNILRESIGITLKTSSITPLLYILKSIPQIMCTIYGGYLICEGDMSVGELVGFMFLLNIMISTVYAVPNMMEECNSIKGVINHMFAICDLPVEKVQETLKEHLKSTKAIEFKNVSFQYDERKKVLHELDLSIDKNKIIAIVGESGAGKSTILKIILGYYLGYTGDVFLDGVKLTENTLKQCRGKIAFVSQDTYLFHDSIYQNITCGCENIKESEVYEVAKAADIHDYIISLRDGYDTIISENSTNISGGQKQRIAIARALLKNSPIILFDEPTSALDLESENVIKNTISSLKGKKTMIIISHRVSTISIADEIIVIKEGQVVEVGSHKQLYNIDSHYRKLYSSETVLSS